MSQTVYSDFSLRYGCFSGRLTDWLPGRLCSKLAAFWVVERPRRCGSMSGFKALSSHGRATPGPLESRAEQSRIGPRTIGNKGRARSGKFGKFFLRFETFNET